METAQLQSFRTMNYHGGYLTSYLHLTVQSLCTSSICGIKLVQHTGLSAF